MPFENKHNRSSTLVICRCWPSIRGRCPLRWSPPFCGGCAGR
jgi:hypothetical protein